MPRKRRYSTEQIIIKLREADVLLSQGRSAEEIARLLEISKQTYYRWRKEYGGLNMTQAKKLKELEKENARLKTLVADLSLDNSATNGSLMFVYPTLATRGAIQSD